MAKGKKETKAKSNQQSAQANKPQVPKSAAPPQRVIDTSHMAESAAAIVASGLHPSAAPKAGGKESASFKHLKETINKPNNAMGNALDKSGLAGGKHSHLPFGHAGKQVGKNQVFGADVNRSGVPRRTGG